MKKMSIFNRTSLAFEFSAASRSSLRIHTLDSSIRDKSNWKDPIGIRMMCVLDFFLLFKSSEKRHIAGIFVCNYRRFDFT